MTGGGGTRTVQAKSHSNSAGQDQNVNTLLTSNSQSSMHGDLLVDLRDEKTNRFILAMRMSCKRWRISCGSCVPSAEKASLYRHIMYARNISDASFTN